VSSWVLAADAATFGASLFLTWLIKHKAWSLGLIDVPNERSSHAQPTPRGGGLAIVIASIATLSALAAGGIIPLRIFLAIVPGGIAVATIGFIDDRKGLSVRIRLFVHFMAAGWAVLCIGPSNLFAFERGSPMLEGMVYALATVGIVWFLNMYNFMDGIDGIAGAQAVFMCLGVALLGIFSVAIAYTAATAVVIGAAALGFLVWNWAPAKIFMGDVGSGYLGFVFAVMGLATGIHEPTAPWTLLILAGVFAVDATFTVIRRFLRRERLTQPHRTHGFQLLARKHGHRKVALMMALVNVLWLLPCAFTCAIWPQYVGWLLPMAFAPLVLGAFAIGSGRPEPISEVAASVAVIIPFPAAELTHKTLVRADEYRRTDIRSTQLSSPDIPERSVSQRG